MPKRPLEEARSKRPDTEFTLWQNTKPEHRSFLVEVLHWFHYRPAALKNSWAREEVMTWELLRALQLLPQPDFLRPILREVGQLSTESRMAVEPLLTAPEITITGYPSLRLDGTKRNCRSDIGFGLSDGPTVWVEAKTAPFKDAQLTAQVNQQRQALAKIFQKRPTVLVTLLPWERTLAGVPNISWSRVAQLFEGGLETMRVALKLHEYRSGYEQVARETLGRIRSHPNKIAENGPPARSELEV